MSHSSVAGRAILFLMVFSIEACDIGIGPPPEGYHTTPSKRQVLVEDFLPPNYVKNGTISYQANIQRAVNSARGGILVFPEATFLLDNENGIELYSDMILLMYGTVFVASQTFARDGQMFYAHDVENIKLFGGEVRGGRANLSASTNIVGVKILGFSSNILIQDMKFQDLSSNGIRVHGNDAIRMAERVVIRGVTIENCSNDYVDYLEPNMGPVPGTEREDQGDVALYFVRDFLVEQSVLKGSHSDATHFYRSKAGVFYGNQIISPKMGGYFLEACDSVEAYRNTVTNAGSRGVSIEGPSHYTVFRDNVVMGSGREGVWVIDVNQCEISHNELSMNGLKDDALVDADINITDTAWPAQMFQPRCTNVYVRRNKLHTRMSQWCAIRATSTARGIVIEGNSLTGPNKVIRADCWFSGVGDVVIRENEGWKVFNYGSTWFQSNGIDREYSIPHGLDFPEPDYPEMLRYLRIQFSMRNLVALDPFTVRSTTRFFWLTFEVPPPAGSIGIQWEASTVYVPRQQGN